EGVVHEAVDFGKGPLAVDAEPDHRELVEVDFGDDWWVDLDRQPMRGATDGVLHILHRDVDIPAQVEEDRDDADSFETLRLDVVDAFNARHGVLDDIGNVEVDVIGRGRLPVGCDADDGEIDLRELADAHFPVAEVAEDDHGRREHHGENRILDAY